MFRPVPLPDDVPGSLWLASMPGRFEPWSAFEAEAKQAGLTLVVCLTPSAEIAELSPRYHALVSRGALPFRWVQVPIGNFGTPSDAPLFRRRVGEIADALRAGEKVMMHCAAGLGRTGSTAACVLKALGLATEEALERVRHAGSNPQNAQQAGFVDWF
jgi:protein-tyrosine phosphatase